MTDNQRMWRINELIRNERPLNKNEDEALELAYDIENECLKNKYLKKIADAVTTPAA